VNVSLAAPLPFRVQTYLAYHSSFHQLSHPLPALLLARLCCSVFPLPSFPSLLPCFPSCILFTSTHLSLFASSSFYPRCPAPPSS
jgi:hypothetical protein